MLSTNRSTCRKPQVDAATIATVLYYLQLQCLCVSHLHNASASTLGRQQPRGILGDGEMVLRRATAIILCL